jgi:hypothetical protein
MRRGLALAGVLLVCLILAPPAHAVQRAQVTCLAPASGDPPVSYHIEREAGVGSGAWDASKATEVAAVPAAAPAQVVDRTAVNGTTYRYRCIAWAGPTAASAGPPSDPSSAITLTAVAGKAGVTIGIIQE